MKVGYVALVGRPNVGKSTLLNRMLGQKVAIISDKPQTTRTNILGIKTSEKGQLIFVDNPGIHRPLHNLNKRMMNIVYSSLETSDLICLLINKVDIVKKEKILLLIDKYKDLLDFKEIIPVSALKGVNVDILEKKIYDFLPEAEKIYSDEEISNQSQRFLMSEIVREKLLSHVREELPFVTAVYVDVIEDYIRVRADDTPEEESKETSKPRPRKYIKASIFIEKDSHRRIILGKRGRMIKAIGTEARLEMEEILGAKVFLDLSVKVRERWRDKADVLDLIEGQK
jgi:GTP-binding protein Era